jgi:hypothetical protein
VARRLERHEPLDLARLDLLQQPIDEGMVPRWFESQQPPRSPINRPTSRAFEADGALVEAVCHDGARLDLPPL